MLGLSILSVKCLITIVLQKPAKNDVYPHRRLMEVGILFESFKGCQRVLEIAVDGKGLIDEDIVVADASRRVKATV